MNREAEEENGKGERRREAADGGRVEATRGSSCGEASSRRVRAGGRVGWTRWFYRLALPSRDETRSVGVRGVGVRGAVGVAGRWVGVGPFWSWTRRPQAAAPAPRYLQPFFSRILLLGHRAIPMRFPRRFWVGSAIWRRRAAEPVGSVACPGGGGGALRVRDSMGSLMWRRKGNENFAVS